MSFDVACFDTICRKEFRESILKDVVEIYGFKDLENALMRLKEVLAIEVTNEIIIDGVIQRFEFTFRLAWKIIKDYLAYEGIEANSPRSAIKAAYRVGLIQDGEMWIDMLMERK